MHGIYVKEKLYICKCIKMHGIYVKEKLYIKMYQDVHYVCEGKKDVLCVCVCVYIYIYVNGSRC